MGASLRIIGFHPLRLALSLFLSAGLRRLLGAVRLGRLFSRGFRSVSGGWLTVVRVRLPCVGGIRVLLLGGGDTTLLVLVLVLRMVPEALSLCSLI
ncbi:hypothetical protein P8452_38402 [Trifolium repens]|nr:hypothetical protein QL285_070649 [Trifolium repens]WJX52272.1 hypothetical protein P8452_38402 [Trifolium repens]